MTNIRNERIRLTASFISKISTGMILAAAILPWWPGEISGRAVVVTVGLFLGGLACQAVALWYVGKVRDGDRT